MSTWKLPRKRKKAFIAQYGRAAYKALRFISRKPQFEGVVEVPCDRAHEPLTIGVDMVYGDAVIMRCVGNMVQVLMTARLRSFGHLKNKNTRSFRVRKDRQGNAVMHVGREYFNSILNT